MEKKNPLGEVLDTSLEKLRALGEDFEWRDVDGFEHEWRFWDLELPRFFAWLPRTDYYADKPHKI